MKFRILFGMLGIALVAWSCEGGASVHIFKAQAFRGQDDARVTVDVEIEADEQGGGAVGRYCVSVHWMYFGFNPFTEPLRSYPGEFESLQQCADDLHDGDRRTYRFVSNRLDLMQGQPARVQVLHAGKFAFTDGVSAP